MSTISITPYFPFSRAKIVKQNVKPDGRESRIDVEPDRRFRPICHKCKQKISGTHSWTQRKVRDLNLANTRVWLTCRYRKLFCPRCHNISTEDLGLFHSYSRMTVRMALYVYELCRVMTVTEVANHLGLNWKTVKNIDKMYLETEYGQPDYTNLRVLAVDEIAIRKGHNYLTVVLDYITGRVIFVGKDRKAKTLERFFNKLTVKQRKSIEAVAMDMWDPFIKAVKKKSRRLKSYSTCSM